MIRHCDYCGIELTPTAMTSQMVKLLQPFVGREITEATKAKIKEIIQIAAGPFARGASCCYRCGWELSEIIPRGAIPIPQQRPFEDPPPGAIYPFWLSMRRLERFRVVWTHDDPWLYDARTLVDWRIGNDQPVCPA